MSLCVAFMRSLTSNWEIPNVATYIFLPDSEKERPFECSQTHFRNTYSLCTFTISSVRCDVIFRGSTSKFACNLFMIYGHQL